MDDELRKRGTSSLELRQVSAGYGGVDVIRGIDLAVRAGEIVTLVGANGAGKSTLVKTISGLVAVRSGTITFDLDPHADVVGDSGYRIAIAAEGIGQAAGKREQAVGGVKQARTTSIDVAQKRSASAQAKAKIAQAKAAVQTAAIQLADARIYAPVSGRISRKTVEVGQYVGAAAVIGAISDADLASQVEEE